MFGGRVTEVVRGANGESIITVEEPNDQAKSTFTVLEETQRGQKVEVAKGDSAWYVHGRLLWTPAQHIATQRLPSLKGLLTDIPLKVLN